MPAGGGGKKGKLSDTLFPVLVLVLQIIFIILFGTLGRYPEDATATDDRYSMAPERNSLLKSYPLFVDMHAMLFVGFGFLWTFLKRYGYSGVGFNFLIAVLAIQWGLIVRGLIHTSHEYNTDTHIPVGIKDLIWADFAAAAVLISFGAILGKVNPLQVLLLALIEIPLACVVEFIGINLFQVVDVGRSMFVHMFGAYFGLACARGLYQPYHSNDLREESIYHADLFSTLGTIFLWVFWPSFNGAFAEGDDQHRAIVNTFLALLASAVATFALSFLLSKTKKFDMVHIQNATLAGGVGVGTMANLVLEPFGALLVGFFAGALSTIGFIFIQPILRSKINLHDTRGVHNVHGLPGILAAIGGAIAAGVASTDTYGLSLYEIFPPRFPQNYTMLPENVQHYPNHTWERFVATAEDRTGGEQAGYQLAALGTTLAIAIVGGFVTGILLKLKVLNGPVQAEVYDDAPHWGLAPELSSTNYTVVRQTAGGDKEILEMTIHAQPDTA